MSDLPANPMSIELTVAHRRLWWHTTDRDHRPESWEVSADIWRLDVCPPAFRHVGDLSLATADLRRDPSLLDSTVLGEWAAGFISEAVIDRAHGRLRAQLDERISPGVPRIVVLQWFELAQGWRGYGLAAALVAGALDVFAPTARLAVCRVAPADLARAIPDPSAAELASARLGTLLERIGFQPWNDLFILDLRSPALAEARMAPLDRWGPGPDDAAG